MGARRVFALSLGLAMVISTPVAAQAAGGTTYTWVGNTQIAMADNHSWGDARNWNPSGVPGDGDSVVIEQPSSGDCFAHVDGTPTVSLVNLTLAENPALCTTSVMGGAISVTGAFMWNGGKLDTPTTIETGATAQVSGTNQRLNALTQDLDVAGDLILSAVTGQGALQILHGRVLHIDAGSSLLSSGTNEIGGSSCCTDPAKVVNDGTIAVDGGTLTIGTAELDQRATVATSLGGVLLTTGAPITTGSAGTYTGNGRWAIENRAAATFSGSQTLGPDFHLELGGLASNASASLAGAATLAGTGTFDWTGGVIEAQLTIGHGVVLNVVGAHTGGGSRVLQGHDFSGGGAGVPVTQTNHGTISVRDGATITTAAQAKLVNAANGILNLSPGTSIAGQSCCLAPDRIDNAGTVRATSAPGTAPATLSFLSYQSSGTTSIAGGHTLQLTGGAPNKLTSGVVTGGGHLSITSPTALSGTVTVATNTRLLLDAHGSLDGTATLSGAGATTWSGGSLSGNLTVATGGGITINGSAVKTIANIGGGSMASLVRLAAPTTIAAGTATAHDVIALGASTLVLGAATSAGTFTEFANGTLTNKGTLNIQTGTVFATTFTQPAAGRLAAKLTSTAHGQLQVTGAVSLHGTVALTNAFTPTLGSKVTVLKSGTMSGAPSCITTSGTGSSGAQAGHWADTQSAAQLTVVWRSGKPTC
ncbi:MAG TPA: hypothetical protein VE442_04810 [Jatrophihabitans sp.]|nr:hypothetical protein [Jatrophihabitans sp.]